jgi:hypothetical protein
MFDLVCLLYSYADTDTIDAGFDEDFLIFIPRDSQRV